MTIDDKRARALAKKQKYEHLLSPFPIKISKAKGKGRCLIAKNCISAGSLIMEEEPVAYSLFKDGIGSVCSVCLKASKELLACPECRNQTFYCSSKCQNDDAIHKEECHIITHLPGICGAHSVDYSLLRLILRYIFARANRKSLGEFQGTNFDCIEDMVGHDSLFGDSWVASIRNAGILSLLRIALDLMDSFVIDSSVEEIIELACKINANSFALYDPFSLQQRELGVSLLPLSALFNHSCYPNSIMYTDSLGRNILHTIKDVSEGEELTISYIDLYLPLMERRGKLLETKNFWCACERCQDEEESGIDLEAILCPNCSLCYLVCKNSTFSCTKCHHSLSSDQYRVMQSEIVKDLDFATDFLKVGHIRGTFDALIRFQDKHRPLLSPHHYLILNSYSSLLNCSVKLQEYDQAIMYTKHMISIMEEAKYLPENWPEKADYYLRLGELLEILKVMNGDSINTQQQIKEAYFSAWNIRKIAYGLYHPATQAANTFSKCGFLKYIAAIDQGTSSSRFMVFDLEGNVVASAQEELPQIFPLPGWVEQDPFEILNSVKKCISQVAQDMTRKNLRIHDIQSIGITNQRETTLVWDKITGEPLHNAIVWLDTRTLPLVDDLLLKYPKDHLQSICGLPISSYFSALKLKWVLENVEKVQNASSQNRLKFGTVDSWLMYQLCGGINGGPHVTDVTNASRTMLMSLETLNWDESLCNFFGISSSILPEIKSSSEIYGTLQDGPLKGIAISGCLGDQQAALVGQGCLRRGSVKNTYGTGCFMLYNTGSQPIFSNHGLLTTVAYKFGNQVAYALEGSVAIAGAAINWLKDNLQIINKPSDVSLFASQVVDTAGVYFVPAFSGLFAPYWTDARGCIVGLTQYSTKQHICLAALEAICFQSKEIIDAMNLDSGESEIQSLSVDGGLTNSALLLQIQADILGVKVNCPNMKETTALGAALAGGLGVEVFKSLDEFKPQFGHISYEPQTVKDERNQRLKMWKEAVKKSMIN